MNIVLDTSIIIALLASDEEQEHLAELLNGYHWICSESLVPELGNAISAMFKRGRISLEQGIFMLTAFLKFDIQYMNFHLERALEISKQYNIYAYDAYVLECAERLQSELITFDSRMNDVAKQLGISIIEV